MSDKITKSPKIRFSGFTDDWEQRKVGDLLAERNDKAPNSIRYPLMAFIANEGVAPKGERYDRSALVNDIENKLYKKTEYGDFIYSSNNLETGSIGLNKYGNATISPVYSIFQPTGLADSDFIGRRLVRKDFINDMIKWRQGVIYGQWRIHEKDFVKIDILVPSVEEQRKIGVLLDNLDNLIALHQRKLLKHKTIKKAMLEKMFPKKGNDVPEIRFEGFTDAWGQSKFSEAFIHLQNNSLSRADLNYEQGKVKNVHYGDVLIKFGEILDVEKAEIPFISNSEFTVSSTSLLQNGDVIITDAAEDETVGKCSEIKGTDGVSVVSGLHTIPCRPIKTFASGYLGYYLNSNAYHDQLLPLIQGTKISSISKSVLHNTDILYPNSEQEQLQIGQFFQSLDNLITRHQRELSALNNLKKSLLQHIFI